MVLTEAVLLEVAMGEAAEAASWAAAMVEVRAAVKAVVRVEVTEVEGSAAAMVAATVVETEAVRAATVKEAAKAATVAMVGRRQRGWRWRRRRRCLC